MQSIFKYLANLSFQITVFKTWQRSISSLVISKEYDLYTRVPFLLGSSSAIGLKLSKTAPFPANDSGRNLDDCHSSKRSQFRSDCTGFKGQSIDPDTQKNLKYIESSRIQIFCFAEIWQEEYFGQLLDNPYNAPSSSPLWHEFQWAGCSTVHKDSIVTAVCLTIMSFSAIDMYFGSNRSRARG